MASQIDQHAHLFGSTPDAEIARLAGVSSQAVYNWKRSERGRLLMENARLRASTNATGIALQLRAVAARITVADPMAFDYSAGRVMLVVLTTLADQIEAGTLRDDGFLS
jgi:hypothetical protein